jgi:hypothetical protein
MRKMNFCILKVTEDFGTDPHPDLLVRGTDPRIRIGTKMLRIWNIVLRRSGFVDIYLMTT